MKKLRLGVIGLGCRGTSLTKMILNCIEEIEVVAVCDSYEDRVLDMVKHIKETQNRDVFGTTDYKEILAKDYVEAVLVSTSWETHVSVSIDALKAGKITAMEVGGAYNVEELWELVDTYEQTKTPFMFMENCCYGKIETSITNMVRKGLFGKIVHCSGAYAHDLRDEVTMGDTNRHYRLRNYQSRNGENYPTHELGPIAKILGINQGNRMVKLVSMASGEFGLTDFVKKHPDTVTQSLLDTGFKQGDIVNTTILCENGESIALKLDTSLPRYYSREFNVQGTIGMYNQLHKAVFFDGGNHWNGEEFNTEEKYINEYQVPIWKNSSPEDLKKGHGGMDFFEFKTFADCALNNKPMPLDVYDAASWRVITCLSEQSIKEGRYVDIPDFTRGKYKDRPLTEATPLE